MPKIFLEFSFSMSKIKYKKKADTLPQTNNPTGKGWKAHWFTGYK